MLKKSSKLSPTSFANLKLSATEIIVVAIAIWFASFVYCPLPASPKYVMFFPKFFTRGRTVSSKTFLSPPAIIDSVPFFAPISPPVTGKSNAVAPTFANSSLIFFANVGEDVVISTKTCPSFAVFIRPFSPRYTSSTSLGYPTIEKITSAFSGASFTSFSKVAPRLIKPSVLEAVLL